MSVVSSLVSSAVANQGLPTKMSFVVDASGSMSSYVERVTDAVQRFIDAQGQMKGDFQLSLAQFDTEYTSLFTGPIAKQIEAAKSEFAQKYQIGGATALRDALVRSIRDAEREIQSAASKPKKTVITLITDGDDNASRTTVQEVKRLVEEKVKQGWIFLLLGVEENTLDVAGQLGIPKDHAVQYRLDNFERSVQFISDKVSGVRRGKPLQITDGERKALLALPSGSEKDL
jgi:Mg-chelatase subunit ChlD